MSNIDHYTLQRLVDAGAIVRAEATGRPGGWEVVISHGLNTQRLVATRGRPCLFRNFSTLATYLRELRIVQFNVNAAEFDASVKDAADLRRTLSSERLNAAHAAADYDRCFRGQVQASIDDERPSVSAEDAHLAMEAKRAELRKRVKAASR